MSTQCLEVPQALFRNFNLCPHCAFNDQEVLLCRLCEGLPMISRSDGETYHLLLADRPLPCSPKNNTVATRKIRLCFWYSHVSRPDTTLSTDVIVTDSRTSKSGIFRRIELVADLLAEKLTQEMQLEEVYELFEDSGAVAAA